MNGRFILDTNIVIAFFRNEEEVVRNILWAEEIFIPSIVAGELYYGAYNSGKPQQNILKFIEFCSLTQNLNCDLNTAKHYGQVKKQLKDRGTPIPENDIWIIALALQHQIPLVSRDKHFNNIDGLELVGW